MSILNTTNRNFQSPLNFTFHIDRLPDFNFFIQKINVPSLNLPTAGNVGGTPFSKVHYPGDHIDFGEISVDFKIDEEMSTWFSVYSWMRGLAFPEKFEQYKNFTVFDEITGIDNKPNGYVNPTNPLYGQGTLFINSSQNNPLFKINYINVHPVSLSELLFDTRETDVMYVTCTASFKYDYFTVEKILPPNE